MRKFSKLSKLLFFSLLAVFVLGCTGQALAAPTAPKPISLFVNGQKIETDVPPYLANDRTMVPLRFATEPLGAQASWEGGSVQAATITRGEITVVVKVGSNQATVNGAEVLLDTPAMLKNGRTMVPMRFIAESLQAQVGWDQQAQAVYITQKDENGNPITTKKDFQYLGYYYSSASLKDLKNFSAELTSVAHFAYELGAAGEIKEKERFATDGFYDQDGGYQTATQNNLDKYMLVTGFSKSRLSTVLSDPALRATAIDNIAQTIATRQLDGVDLDFESIAPEQKANFVLFVQELRAKLGPNKVITLSLMPRSAANQTWLDGYDYQGLAASADYIMLMCYNEHYSGGSPGAVASTAWLRKVIDYTLAAGVPKEKMIIALGCYGYDWPAGKNGASLTNTSARARAAQYGATITRDSASGVPHFAYTDKAGVAHQVWFEDAISMGQKAAIAKEYDLGGLAFWRLGFYTDEIWTKILEATNHANAPLWLNKTTVVDEFTQDYVAPTGGTDIENNGEIVGPN